MNRFLSKFFSANRKSAIQNPKWAGLLTIVVALTACGARAEAQQTGKVHRIGYLSPGSGPGALTEVFRQGLRDLGYVEGQNLVIEYRWTGPGGTPTGANG